MILPEVVTPKALAQQLGWAEKRVRRLAKQLGACSILGNRMVLLAKPLSAEFTECSPNARHLVMRYVRSRNVVRSMIGLGAARIEVPVARDDRRLGSIPGPRSPSDSRSVLEWRGRHDLRSLTVQS